MPKQDVSLIGRRFAVKIIKWGASLLQSSFKLKPELVRANEIKNKLQYLPSLSLSDKKYYAVPIAKWREIIEVDWTDEKKYMADKYDCDNFAFQFAASMARHYGLNTAGVAYGKMGGVGHAFNVIYATDGIKVLEPQTDDWADLPKGATSVTFRGKEYSINWIIFF